MKICKEKYMILHSRFLICHLLNTKNKQQLSKSFKYYNFYLLFFYFLDFWPDMVHLWQLFWRHGQNSTLMYQWWASYYEWLLEITFCAVLLAEEPVEALVTVGLVSLLLEGPFVQLLQAKTTKNQHIIVRYKLSNQACICILPF